MTRREFGGVDEIRVERFEDGEDKVPATLIVLGDTRLLVEGDPYTLVAALLSTLKGEEVVKAYGTAQSLIRTTTFPALVEEEVTDDGETYKALRCPVCTDLVDEGDLFAISPAEHWAPNDYPDDDAFDHHRVTFDSDERPDLEETLYYSHGNAPGHIVDLPDGWSEDWT